MERMELGSLNGLPEHSCSSSPVWLECPCRAATQTYTPAHLNSLFAARVPSEWLVSRQQQSLQTLNIDFHYEGEKHHLSYLIHCRLGSLCCNSSVFSLIQWPSAKSGQWHLCCCLARDQRAPGIIPLQKKKRKSKGKKRNKTVTSKDTWEEWFAAVTNGHELTGLTC